MTIVLHMVGRSEARRRLHASRFERRWEMLRTLHDATPERFAAQVERMRAALLAAPPEPR